MILMWSCPGNMPKYYPGLRDILPDRRQTTLLYKYVRFLHVFTNQLIVVVFNTNSIFDNDVTSVSYPSG